MARAAWKKIGQVGVDAGCVMIGDPCYLLDPETGQVRFDYEADVCGVDWSTHRQLAHRWGGGARAVLVKSGFGDGIYDVEALIQDGTVLEVRIRFVA